MRPLHTSFCVERLVMMLLFDLCVLMCEMCCCLRRAVIAAACCEIWE